MKTITLSIAFIMCCLTHKAQDVLSSSPTTNYNLEANQLNTPEILSPVYFNFHKRELRDLNKKVISATEFLNLCRNINDTAIQIQVARYDSFTKDKQRLGLIALGSGFAAMGLFGSAGATAGQGNDVITGSFAFFGVVGALVIPAAAIYSSVPHQKRKAVLFRDLPVAYNHYVETHYQPIY
jgi:hypothetical protein